MATEWRRMTFAVMPELDGALHAVKKDFFYDRTQSDMIRQLLAAGLRAAESEKQEKRSAPAKCFKPKIFTQRSPISVKDD